MNENINNQFQEYNTLAANEKERIIRKMGLHKNVGDIENIILSKGIKLSRKIIRQIHNDVTFIIKKDLTHSH